MRGVRYIRWGIIIFLGVLAGIVFFYLFKGVSPKKEIFSSIPNTTQPELGMERFELIETVNGVKRWRLTSTEAQFFEDVVRLKEIDVVFFKDDQAILNISGEKGALGRQNKDIRVYSNVVAIGDQDKAKLTTSSLTWQPDPGVLFTPDKFTLIRNDTRIVGKGLKMDPEMEQLEIKENVAIEIGKE